MKYYGWLVGKFQSVHSLAAPNAARARQSRARYKNRVQLRVAFVAAAPFFGRAAVFIAALGRVIEDHQMRRFGYQVRKYR